MAKLEHYTWAKTPEEVAALVKLGWVVPEQRRTHHHFHAVSLKWAKPGEPVLPERGRG